MFYEEPYNYYTTSMIVVQNTTHSRNIHRQLVWKLITHTTVMKLHVHTSVIAIP